MVTHDPELARIAPRIITLKDGQVISDTRNGVSLMEEDRLISLEEQSVDSDTGNNVSHQPAETDGKKINISEE